MILQLNLLSAWCLETSVESLWNSLVLEGNESYRVCLCVSETWIVLFIWRGFTYLFYYLLFTFIILLFTVLGLEPKA